MKLNGNVDSMSALIGAGALFFIHWAANGFKNPFKPVAPNQPAPNTPPDKPSDPPKPAPTPAPATHPVLDAILSALIELLKQKQGTEETLSKLVAVQSVPKA